MSHQGPANNQEDQFETEYLDEEDDDDVLDEQLERFYDEKLNLDIDTLVNKLLALHPLLSACIYNTPSILRFVLNNDPERRKLQGFTTELKRFLSPIDSNTVDVEALNKFLLAFEHMKASSGYSMSKYLHKHLFIFEFLKETTEALFSTQQAYLSFFKSDSTKKRDLLRKSLGLNEASKKIKKRCSLRATQ